MSDQLTFDLPCYPALGFEEFFVSKANKLAFEVINNWSDWTNFRVLITGKKGSGKTHLSHVWANLSDAKFIKLGETEHIVQNVQNLVIEDIDRIVSKPNLEEQLLHLINSSQQFDRNLLMTSSVAASRLAFNLSDLSSRLQATEHCAINPPDDALLSAVLIKQFSDRQINMSPGLIDYILKRITRSMFSVASFVQILDDLMLKSKKSPSRQMISEVLDKIAKNKA